jgi:hypothetical protein
MTCSIYAQKAQLGMKRGHLLDSRLARQENEQIFSPPPKLSELRRYLDAAIKELPQYKVWPVSDD